MTMQLPAFTAAARAQRHADVLARCITAASTPEQADRYRRCYHRAAARAAALTRRDISGHREEVLDFLRCHRFFVVVSSLVLVAQIVFVNVAPGWLQNDARWLAVGLSLGALAMWLAVGRTAGDRTDTYEDYGEPADDC